MKASNSDTSTSPQNIPKKQIRHLPHGSPRNLVGTRRARSSLLLRYLDSRHLPPYSLYNPMLPLRQGKKLTFPLCQKCVEDESVKPMLGRNYYYSHGVEDRMLTGTWCTPEIMKAVEKGYQVLRIHEAWHFPPDQRK